MLYRSVTPLVYTLSVSMQASNDDLVYASKRKVYFNLLLADYFMKQLPLLWLDDLAVKYMNDTWLLMSESQDDVAGMCCLAVMVSEKFGMELASATGIPNEILPDLKISVTSSRGRRIKLAGGQNEWITRETPGVVSAGGLKAQDYPGRVVTDKSVCDVINKEFLVDKIEDKTDNKERSFEERGSLYLLSGMKNDALINKHSGIERFIYAAGMLEKIPTPELRDAVSKALAELCSDMTSGTKAGKEDGINNDPEDTGKAPLSDRAKQSIARRFNSLIAGVNDYEFSVNLLSGLPDSKWLANTATYALLIGQARNYDEVKTLVERLIRDEVGLDSRILTNIITKAPDFATAKTWLDFAGTSEIALEGEAYNRCITKAPDFAMANTLYDDMLAKGVAPDIATYVSMISKSHDVETSRTWLKTLLDEDLLPNLFIFNRIIAKCVDYVAALEVFNEISVIGIKPNAITYNTLVSRASDYETAGMWIDTMNKQEVHPNVDTFVRLFSKDLGTVKAVELLDSYLVWGLPSEEPIQTAISTYQKNGRVDQALYLAVDYPHLPSARKLIREIMSDVMAYLEDVKDDKAAVSLEGYNSLIENAPFYDTAMPWLEAMKKNGIKPDAATYSALIEKAPDFETGKSWIDAMIESGFEPDDDVYSALFSKNLANTTAEDLIAWFKNQSHYSDTPIAAAMRTYGGLGLPNHALRIALEYPQLEKSRKIIKEHVNLIFNYLKTVCEESSLVNVEAYGELISKAPYYDVAESWLDIMKSKGVRPDIAIYNTLLAKAPDYETATVLLQAIIEEKAEPNVVTFGTLIAKSPNYETAKQWFKAMLETDMKPNVVIYSALMSKASDYPTSRALLDEMKSNGVKPNVISYNTAIHSATDYVTAKGLIDEMFKQKVQPNVVTFNRLFSKNLKGVTAAELFKWYSGLKNSPDDPMQAAISTYRKMGLIEDARYLATRYPGLAISKKVMAEKAATEDVDAVKDLDMVIGVSGDGSGNGPSGKLSGNSGLEKSEGLTEDVKRSNMMKQCLKIMDDEISSTVGT